MDLKRRGVREHPECGNQKRHDFILNRVIIGLFFHCKLLSCGVSVSKTIATIAEQVSKTHAKQIISSAINNNFMMLNIKDRMSIFFGMAIQRLQRAENIHSFKKQCFRRSP
jgi:hypothetical protein